MDSYKQLTSEKRYQIWALLKVVQTQKDIAEVLGKHKSTISRELKHSLVQCLPVLSGWLVYYVHVGLRDK